MDLPVAGKLELPMINEWDVYSGMRIGSYARKQKIRLMHAHTAKAHSLGIIAHRFCSARLIVTRRVGFPLKSGFISRWKYRKADHIIAISSFVRQHLLDSGIEAGKISIVHSGIDFNSEPKSAGNLRRELKIPDSAVILGTMGALTDQKDYPTLLNAFQRVADEIPQAILLILGEGSLRREVEKMIMELKLYNKVKLMGYRKEVTDFLKLFDLYVQSSWNEGLCTSIIKAMHEGLPVISTDSGGPADLIDSGKNGILVPIRDSRILAEAILEVIKDKKLMIKLGHNAAITAPEFSAEKMTEKTEQTYLKLLDYA